MKSVFLSFLLVICVFSCGQSRIVGNGNMGTITRNISPDFQGIQSNGSFDVEIYDGNQDGKITIQGETNIIEHIKTEVKNGILIIKFEENKSYTTRKDIKVKLNSNQLSSIQLFGSGDIETKGIQTVDKFTASVNGSGDIEAKVNANQVNLEISGSGDIEISGKAKNLEINTRGSGDVEAFKLITENVNIQKSGSGDSEVNCSQILKINSKGSGDVYYKGNPTSIEKNSTGSGKVYKKN